MYNVYGMAHGRARRTDECRVIRDQERWACVSVLSGTRMSQCLGCTHCVRLNLYLDGRFFLEGMDSVFLLLKKRTAAREERRDTDRQSCMLKGAVDEMRGRPPGVWSARPTDSILWTLLPVAAAPSHPPRHPLSHFSSFSCRQYHHCCCLTWLWLWTACRLCRTRAAASRHQQMWRCSASSV